jgi:NAD(P)-dependent dehydrogenase (short-subunit alcohol dehydrogenase family)
MQIEAGQVAVVTGGASGIGLALCHEFGRRGMAVVAADIEQGALDAAVAELGAAGIDALGVICDVRSSEAVDALADTAFEWKGHVNVLCNNAGVVHFGDAFESLDDWKWVIDVDMWGVVHGALSFVPRMKESGQPGHVVNTASTAGLLGFATIASYTAAKHAVVGMSQSMWHELQNTNVSMSVLCPGVVSTNINTSHRNKPGVDPDSVEKETFGAGYDEALTPAEVATFVAEGIESDQFWMLPHPRYADMALTLAEGRVNGGPPVLPRPD